MACLYNCNGDYLVVNAFAICLSGSATTNVISRYCWIYLCGGHATRHKFNNAKIQRTYHCFIHISAVIVCFHFVFGKYSRAITKPQQCHQEYWRFAFLFFFAYSSSFFSFFSFSSINFIRLFIFNRFDSIASEIGPSGCKIRSFHI